MEVIQNPIIIVKDNDGKQDYIIGVTALDPKANEPERFGVILSDLLDHVARAYADLGLGESKTVRAHIVKTLNNEDRFKEQDPNRGKITGKTVMPKAN